MNGKDMVPRTGHVADTSRTTLEAIMREVEDLSRERER